MRPSPWRLMRPAGQNAISSGHCCRRPISRHPPQTCSRWRITSPDLVPSGRRFACVGRWQHLILPAARPMRSPCRLPPGTTTPQRFAGRAPAFWHMNGRLNNRRLPREPDVLPRPRLTGSGRKERRRRQKPSRQPSTKHSSATSNSNFPGMAMPTSTSSSRSRAGRSARWRRPAPRPAARCRVILQRQSTRRAPRSGNATSPPMPSPGPTGSWCGGRPARLPPTRSRQT